MTCAWHKSYRTSKRRFCDTLYALVSVRTFAVVSRDTSSLAVDLHAEEHSLMTRRATITNCRGLQVIQVLRGCLLSSVLTPHASRRSFRMKKARCNRRPRKLFSSSRLDDVEHLGRRRRYRARRPVCGTPIRCVKRVFVVIAIAPCLESAAPSGDPRERPRRRAIVIARIESPRDVRDQVFTI